MQSKSTEQSSGDRTETGLLTVPGKLGMFHVGRRKPWDVLCPTQGGLGMKLLAPYHRDSQQEEERGVGKLRRLLKPDPPRPLAAQDQTQPR